MKLNRRSLRGAGGAVALAGPAVAQGDEDARLLALFDRYFNENVDESPQSATSLGLDTGARAHLKAQLDDNTAAERLRRLERTRRRVAELKAIDRGRLTPARKVDLDVILYGQENALRSGERFRRLNGRPYVLSQQNGRYASVPNMLDAQHRVTNEADAEAYLSRLSAFARRMDEDLDMARADAARGIIPPDFICDLALGQMRALRGRPAAQSNMATALAAKARAAGLTKDYGTLAADRIEREVYPALDRQIAVMADLRTRAGSRAGIGHLPDGPALYADRVRASTTTDMTPDEIHRLGLAQVAELTARIDAILKGQGYTRGTVGQRMAALNADPAQLYPNTDEGRGALLASLNAQMDDMLARLPQAFGTLPKARCEVRRVPVTTQDGASNGYYQSAAIDGSRPGAFYINLKDTTEWPRYSLPTLVYHEATPGHHLQIALSQESTQIPQLRRTGGGSAAFSEGWGLYAEQLADEMGVYEGRPLDRAGFLQSLLFRSARLVIDTGLHSKGWSRDRATSYMTDVTGYARTRNEREIDRYCVNPGQATSYKIGHNKWVELRERARRRLGPNFDLRAFHDHALLYGNMPLAVLERQVDDWVKSRA
jgi:uncharacterized protein (DUF885 family)